MNAVEELVRPNSASDEALVLAALVADYAAFDELIRRYRGAAIVTAQSVVGSRAAAEEIAQDVFVIAFRTLPSLDDPAKFGGWIRAIARFRALRVAERERRTQPMEPETLTRLSDDRSAGSGADPADHALRSAEREAVWQAMNELSADHREALYLHYIEEWPLERIAAFLSVPESTVKGRLFRAREALRRRLIAEPTFDDIRKTTQGKNDDERTERQQRGNPPTAPTAQANVHRSRTFEPDRGAGGRGAGSDRPVQPHPSASERTGRDLAVALREPAVGRVVRPGRRCEQTAGGLSCRG